MTDAKPVDPLEALRVLASPQAYTETPSPFQAHTQQVCAAAIAAWEKERADWKETFRQVYEAQQQSHSDLVVLQRAVEKVRDELRTKNLYDFEWAVEVLRQADALDAALGGGA